MNWDEGQHPRNGQGEFTHSSIGAWAVKAAEQLGRTRDVGTSQQAARDGHHPPGYNAAVVANEELWDIADQGAERTDAEQDQLNALEDAFKAYRNQLGLKQSSGDLYEDGRGHTWTRYGEYLGRVNDRVPAARQAGHRRVGEHPEGTGSIQDVQRGRIWSMSTHPDAGGLWIDPGNPGTLHAPRYLNDAGTPVSGLRPSDSPSLKRKRDIQSRRREGGFGRPEEGDTTTTWHGTERSGRLGYGLADSDVPETNTFIAHMKRAQARARIEGSARQPKRRTPRGTPVEGWMGKVNGQMEQRGAGRG